MRGGRYPPSNTGSPPKKLEREERNLLYFGSYLVGTKRAPCRFHPASGQWSLEEMMEIWHTVGSRSDQIVGYDVRYPIPAI